MSAKLLFNGQTHQLTLIGSNAEPPGTAHPTMGCIRTNDEAMRALVESMRVVPLTTIEVINNNAPLARAASKRNRRGRNHV